MWIIFVAGLVAVLGTASGWDYTDDIDREWDVQDPRLLPGISRTKYSEKASNLIKASNGFREDSEIFSRYLQYGRLSLDLAMAIQKNMTSYCEVTVKEMEDDFNAAYAAFTNSGNVLQAAYNELTEAEKEEIETELKESESGNERRRRFARTLPNRQQNRREDPNSPEFEYEDLRAERDTGEGYYYEGSGSGDDITEAPPTEAPEYDRRLWPTLYREELMRNQYFKDSADQLRDIVKMSYDVRLVLEASLAEMKENMTVENLINGIQNLQHILVYADTQALYAYIGLHSFATFGEAYAVYPEEGRENLYTLWYKLIQSRIMANNLEEGTSWFPVKYWQDYTLIDKHDANCTGEDISVVDCPLTYLKKYGITVIDVKKFSPWLKMFNKGRRVRVHEVSVRLGGAVVSGNDNVTMEIFNVGQCKDYYLFEEHSYLGPPVHMTYVYDQDNYEKRLLQPVHQADATYYPQTTPFTKWLIVFEKVLNPNLDLSGVMDLQISWSGEVTLNPYP